jgi:hypothetical protein
MIELSEVLSIHKILIQSFGGATGVRDESSLSSALQRPFQTFDGQFVYKSILEKADRMSDLEISKTSFRNKYDFNIKEMFVHSFGILNLENEKPQKNSFIFYLRAGTIRKKLSITSFTKSN